MLAAVAALDGDRLGQVQHVPDLVDPGADRDHHLVAGDGAAVGDDRGDGLGVVAGLEAGDLGAGHDAHAEASAFLARP